MEPQPDKLFRDKLGQYQKSAPPAAWDRIEAGLQKPRRSFLFLQIAASFMLLVTASYFLWPTAKSVQHVDAVEKAEHDEVVPAVDVVEHVDAVEVVENVEAAEQHSISLKENLSDHNAPGKSFLIRSKEKETKSTQATISTSHIPDNKIVPEESAPVVISEPEASTETEVAQQAQATETVAVNTTKPTLHFAANEVNAKYKKISPQAQATPDQKNPSIMQKIADVAMDITNDDGLLGELREKKNEFLSLDRLNRSHGPNK